MCAVEHLLFSSPRSFVVTLGERRSEQCLSYPRLHALVSGPCAWSSLNDSSGSGSPFDLTLREEVSLHFPKTHCGKTSMYACLSEHIRWRIPQNEWLMPQVYHVRECVLSLNHGKSLRVEGFLAHTCTLLLKLKYNSPQLLRVKSHTLNRTSSLELWI